MGNLNIYYNDHNDLLVGDILKIKIDDSIKAEIRKNEFLEFDLEEGVHNIKMYFEGFSADEMYGYIDQNIDIKENNNYYIYQAPKTLKGKVKFEKKEFNSNEEFMRFVKHTNKKYKIWGIILLILAILVIPFLQ